MLRAGISPTYPAPAAAYGSPAPAGAPTWAATKQWVAAGGVPAPQGGTLRVGAERYDAAQAAPSWPGGSPCPHGPSVAFGGQAGAGYLLQQNPGPVIWNLNAPLGPFQFRIEKPTSADAASASGQPLVGAGTGLDAATDCPIQPTPAAQLTAVEPPAPQAEALSPPLSLSISSVGRAAEGSGCSRSIDAEDVRVATAMDAPGGGSLCSKAAVADAPTAASAVSMVCGGSSGSAARPVGPQVWPRPIDSAGAVDNPKICRLQASVTGAASASKSAAGESATDSPGCKGSVEEILAAYGYQVEGVLGKGAFGTVYKGRRGDTDFALKLIEGVSQFGSRVHEEINCLKLLRHPAIVSLDCEIPHPSRDWLFLVQEFLEGGDLAAALIGTPQFFEEKITRPMMYHIASAVAYSHELSVLHRDLKPENILLRRDGFPKVADFGLAREVSAHQVCQTVAGTPGYMAPEVQTMTAPYNFPADVYSLGLVFADMMHESTLSSWCVDALPEPARHTKKWPSDARPHPMSDALRNIHAQMLYETPGERLTLFHFCAMLRSIRKELPHPMWEEPTPELHGPPPTKTIAPEDAREIAGRMGYAIGSPVHVFTEGSWQTGRIHHISTNMCPGAAQVHYQSDGQLKAILVCPWQFQQLLRPVPVAAGGLTNSNATMVFQAPPVDTFRRPPSNLGSGDRGSFPTAESRGVSAGETAPHPDKVASNDVSFNNVAKDAHRARPDVPLAGGQKCTPGACVVQ